MVLSWLRRQAEHAPTPVNDASQRGGRLPQPVRLGDDPEEDEERRGAAQMLWRSPCTAASSSCGTTEVFD